MGFCSPEKYLSSSDHLQLLSSITSLMAVFKDMRLVCTPALPVSSILSPVLPRYWEKLHSLPNSLWWQELFWPPEWNSQKLFNVSLPPPVFIGDSEIILDDHKEWSPGPPVFYGTRLLEILSVSSPESWFWCPGLLNPAYLLTKSGTNCNQINSRFWLHGSFLPLEGSTCSTTLCTSIPACDNVKLYCNYDSVCA